MCESGEKEEEGNLDHIQLTKRAEVVHPDKKEQEVGKTYDLRYRPNIQFPDRYTDPGRYPILIKGTQGHYIRWQTLDLAGLVARLPNVHVGASKWIRAFEEQTIRKLLALGDIKAVWAQTLGAPAMKNILRQSGNGLMVSPRADGTEFNAYRTALWQALQYEYPIRIDPRALKGEPLMDSENPAVYINKELKR